MFLGQHLPLCVSSLFSTYLMQQEDCRLFLVFNVAGSASGPCCEKLHAILHTHIHTYLGCSQMTKLCQTLQMQTIYGIFILSCICFANAELKALRGDCPLNDLLEERLLSGYVPLS